MFSNFNDISMNFFKSFYFIGKSVGRNSASPAGSLARRLNLNLAKKTAKTSRPTIGFVESPTITDAG